MNQYILQEKELLKELYQTIRKVPLEWIELHEVKDEICDCLLVGYNQAAIALTNHFFERIMKLALIYHSADNAKFGSLDVFDTIYKDAVDLYDDKQLHCNIEKCRKEGLISIEKEKTLIKWKEKVRNGFSHAELKKAKVYSASFADPAGGQLKEIPLHTVLFMQGIAQKEWAESVAPMFFKEVFYTLLEIEKKVNFGNTTLAP